jgi:hypothetical protein
MVEPAVCEPNAFGFGPVALSVLWKIDVIVSQQKIHGKASTIGPT